MTSFSVLAAAREEGQRVALVRPDGSRLTFAELGERVAKVASVLAEAGLKPRDRAALWATTREPTLLAVLAMIELGVTVVPVHPRLSASEAETLMRATSPARIFLEDDLDDLVVRARRAEPLSSAPAPARSELLAILFTSGTTGRAKGAILSRAAFAASAEASAKNLGWQDDDAWLLAMPLCHVGGLSIVTRSIAARRAMVLEERFDADRALAAIARGATMVSVVPTMLKRLLEADRANALAGARAVLVGGAACPAALLEACAERGIAALTTYGLTEACSQVTCQAPRPRHTTEAGSGRPLAGTEVRIEDGRILVRGPTLMDGYWSEPRRRTEDWFDTGDLGELDEQGRLHVHTRRVDLIVTGGENVYPAEVEAALEACPGVRRALVFGVPDAEWGELVACVLEKDPTRPAAEPEIYSAMVRVLATHKRPRRVWFDSALPTTGEKLDRSAGKARFAPLVRPWERAPRT